MLGNIALTIGAILLILAVLAAIVIPIVRASTQKEQEEAARRPELRIQDERSFQEGRRNLDTADEQLNNTYAEVAASARQKLNAQ